MLKHLLLFLISLTAVCSHQDPNAELVPNPNANLSPARFIYHVNAERFNAQYEFERVDNLIRSVKLRRNLPPICMLKETYNEMFTRRKSGSAFSIIDTVIYLHAGMSHVEFYNELAKLGRVCVEIVIG